MIKFNKYNVTDTETKVKARVHYNAGERFNDKKELVQAVTIYAKDYDRKLGEIFAAEYKNETDSMTDYFDQGNVVLFADHPLYKKALARAEAA